MQSSAFDWFNLFYQLLQKDQFNVELQFGFLNEKVFGKRFGNQLLWLSNKVGSITNFSTNPRPVTSKQMMSCCFLMLYVLCNETMLSWERCNDLNWQYFNGAHKSVKVIKEVGVPVIATFARFELSGRSTMLSFRDWLNDRRSLSFSLSLAPSSLSLSNVNEFKQTRPLPIQLSFSFPLFLSPQNISNLGKFLLICSHRLNEFNWECIGPDAHPLRERSSDLAYICRAAPCSSIVPSASFTNRSSERTCERKLSQPGGGTPWYERSCVLSVHLCF